MSARIRWYLVVLVLLCSSGCSAAPSKQMLRLLNSRLDAAQMEQCDLWISIRHIYDRLRYVETEYVPRFGVEHVDGSSWPQLDLVIPAGTLYGQLGHIAQSYGYVWYANGDWINFVPKDKAFDPTYVMNQRIAGEVVMSRMHVGENRMADWLKANNVSVAKDVHRLTFGSQKPGIPEPICPDPTILWNPSVRQVFNTHNSLYGQGTWTANIRIIPSSLTYGRPGASIVESSQPLHRPLPLYPEELP